MLKLIYLLTVLIASFHAINAVQKVGLPTNIPKCKPADELCLSRIFTQLIQNNKEYPEFNIPDLQLCQPKTTIMTHTRGYDTLKLLSYTARASNLSTYGLNNLQVLRIRGFGPHLNCTDIYAELLFPWTETRSSFKADVEMLSLLKFPASGNVTVRTTSVRVPLRMKSEIIQRNGEQYLQINSIKSTHQVLRDFKMNVKFDTLVPELVQGFINEQTNSNWKLLKPIIDHDIEGYISESVYNSITPLFTRVPIQDFFL